MNRALRTMAVIAVAAAAVFGCSTSSPVVNEETMDIAALPTLKETQTQMLDLVVAVQAEIRRIVPGMAPFIWSGAWSNSGCPNDPAAAGAALYFPQLRSPSPITDTQWDAVLPAVGKIANGAGLAGNWEPHAGTSNAPTAKDIRFTSDDGRQLTFISREATVLSATITCRRDVGDLFTPNERLPLPPNP